jgi:hypothetical protein
VLDRILSVSWGKWALFILGWAALTLLFTPDAYLYFYLRRQVKLLSGPSDDRAFGVREFLVEDKAGNVLQFFATLK